MKVFLWLCLSLVAAVWPSVGRPDAAPREILVNGVEFVYVPAGWFWQSVQTGEPHTGLPDQDNKLAGPARDVRVWVDGFYMAKYEARARDFIRFMSSQKESKDLQRQYDRGAREGCSVRRDEAGTYYMVRPQDDLPVTHISWRLANDMARWLGFRLPTEAEWTRAARGDDLRHWPWGNEYPDDTFAGYEGGAECNPSPVGTFVNGVSPFGVHDLAGNVWEYVDDWYNPAYYLALKNGDRNPKPAEAQPARSDTNGVMMPLKVLRGGRWGSGAGDLSNFSRTTAGVDETFQCYGTRFAMDESVAMTLLKSGNASVVEQ